MQNNSKKKILIIANTRFKGGLSGGDAIYDSFIKHWEGYDIRTSTLLEIDYNPFIICYLHRIIVGCFMAIFDSNDYLFVYSASDFLPDSLPAWIYKCKGQRWVAGFFLQAFKNKRLYYLSQKLVKKIIEKFADMVIVTNTSMFPLFPNKKKTWINGVVHKKLAKGKSRKVYDAVFCGRIHPTKGIDELVWIWKRVRQIKPNAQLAVIGDGDLGKEYMATKLPMSNGVHYFGFLGDDRYDVFKKSKVVLYPTPYHYDHFSIAPVEAMLCGCPIICFDTPVIKHIEKTLTMEGGAACADAYNFCETIISFISGEWKHHSKDARAWAKQFDEPLQAKRVLKDIRKELLCES